MDKLYIEIDGKKVPCKLGYLAYKEFESHFKPMFEMNSSLEDAAKFFWCGLVAQSKKEGVEFSMTFEQFEVWMDEDNMQSFHKVKQLQEDSAAVKSDEPNETSDSKNAESPSV